ncbi:uncharacterized protein LOC133523124 [Cydia pomonella]|uniref:uncharacterized protein LOC133523124 n=1 Tax=Cydia pomonella TaxID=82600 RepID=UPI002ADE1DD5|nr:uncharacterized protein LOC133523124 [Cydia pomonella]
MSESHKGDGEAVVRDTDPPALQAAVPALHKPMPTPSRVASGASSRSSSTIVARQLEAKAQHARRLAEMEKERERQSAERERQVAERAAERERQVAELELQANLAAIEAGGSRRGSHGTRSRASVQEWVNNTIPNHNEQHLLSANPPFRFDDIAAQHEPLESREQHGVSAAAIKNSPEQNRPEDGGVTRLVNSLDKLINKVNQTKIDLPNFDGKSHLDWLALKRVYENKADSFSPTENLARLSRALRGTAREAVAGLLAAARDPGAVVAALDARFGRPELVVMHEVTAVRALPKVSYDGKDLVIFASRVRNCVEVIRMLNKPDHLRSPELFQALWSKLPALLRPRWLDYAHSCNGSASKIEMFADFLSREVDLQCRFGGAIDHAPALVSRPIGNRDKINIIAENNHSSDSISTSLNTHNNFENNCPLCKQNHDLSVCDKFIKLSINDRWQFIKKNKMCHRCLKKGFHKNKTSCLKKVCSVEGCEMRHHNLLHGSKSERVVTAHVDVEDDDAADDDSDADDEQVPSTSSVTAPAACNVSEAAPLLDDSEHDILTHATSSSPKVPSARPLLKIVAVTVSGPTGSVDTFALLDDGSSGTYIDSEISSQIGAKASDRLIHLDCVVGLSKDIKVQYVNFNIQGRHSTEVHSIKKARSINGLGAARQCAYQDSVRKYPYLADIAGEFCYGDVKPMLIIGLDNWHLSLATDVRKGTKTQPAAILTALGWVLFGFGCSKTKRVDVVNHITLSETDSDSDCFTLERLIREQFKIDSIGISKKEARNADDERAIQVLESTAHRLPGGRFEVGLLWKADNLDIPDSYKLALSRFLSLEKKMMKDPCYAERYRHNVHDMLSKEYAEQCSSGPASGRPVWYLPHFGVINPNKPNKLRTVHDAAAKSHGVSLNSLLLTGPDLLQPLLGILMRFREGAIALNADIREMFPQIKIIEKDRDAQRFLWRDTPSEPVRTFRMSSMIFGAASSPFTAIHIKNKNALEWQETYPEAARVIIDDHYMDDCITSLDEIDKAAKLAADIYTVHAHAGFEMRSWTSNSPSALSLLPKESLLEVPRANNIDVELGRLATPVRTLGLIWQPANDLIGFNTGVKKDTVLPEKLTKRGVLVHVMRIYDPLGILAPIVVRGRIMFQDAWRKGLNWDQELSQCDSAAWKSWFQDLISTSSLRIPRRYNLSDLEVAGCELHVFSDASESAYAAVAYWRFLYVNGDIRLSLICSKVRVSPIRPVSIPRLELQGALIAARLAMSICEAHRLKPMRRVFWCDSMTVLGWLRSDARTLKPFVSHRVGEILELTNISEWHWVPSDLNVADDATRVKRIVLSTESRWISGPGFLLSSDWPAEPQVDVSGLGREEYKNIIHLITETDLPAPVSADPSRFSSWLRMVRATAKAHLFISLLRMRSMRRRDANFNLPRLEGHLCTFHPTCTSSPGTSNPPNIPPKITASDIRLAETHILRQSQLDSFKEDILRIKNRDPLPRSSRLFKLSPFLDDNGQLRMFSRIAAAAGVTDEVKRPLILDGKHPAVRLLIARYHQKAGHANKEKVLNELHQRFWILGLRNAARSVAHGCQFCKLRRARTFTPPMGNLPECRLAHHQRPFSFVGLDYFGPVLVSVGRRREKRYVALFTCLVIRAVHLEVVHSLTTDAAIMCLRRFIARRGTPQEIWSDHGTAFVGANRELRALYADSVEDFAANESINWRFIPPAAPFMGGAWERLVRSVKGALKVTLREQAPSDEVLSTLLAEAEALVNTRPLTHVSLDSDADEALTPAHFILTSPSGRPIPATLTEADLLSRNKWRRAVRLADHFWQRWVKEYLPCLSPRTGGGSPPNIAVGDVVIVCDSNLPRGSWPKGRITALYPGRDGIVRVADIATAAGVLRRPLKKLAKVPVSVSL